MDNSLYALDSSTVGLCLCLCLRLCLFDWAPFRSTKAAIKLHTLLDRRGAIPAFIHISDGKMSDVKVLDMLSFEAGAFYVMDRGYLDFTRLHRLHQAGAFFVTRAKRGMHARRVYLAHADRSTCVICDQLVMLCGNYSVRNSPRAQSRPAANVPRQQRHPSRPSAAALTAWVLSAYGIRDEKSLRSRAHQEAFQGRAYLLRRAVNMPLPLPLPAVAECRKVSPSRTSKVQREIETSAPSAMLRKLQETCNVKN